MNRRTALVLLTAVLALLLSGCVGLPRSGGVRSVAAEEQADAESLVDFTPGGPKKGSKPVPLADNWLQAMTATPLSVVVARQFLTSGSSQPWDPERGTIVYGSHTLTSLSGGHRVRLHLGDVVELDGRGAWLGDPTGGKGLDIDLRMVQEDGEWRISRPPNRLIVPLAHFDTQYQQYFLYFFDKSAQALVPEPVYVPRGLQATTLLVSSLLAGPSESLRGVETTFVPSGAHLDDISVPVSRDGTAEVPLSDEVLDLDDDQLNLLYAQMAWTLGQVAGVERLRITVGRTPVDLRGMPADVSVNQWSEFDPALAWASTALFGLRDGRMVTLAGGEERRVGGPFGTLQLGLRSLAVDLPAQHTAGVTGDGTRVLEADKDRSTGEPATLADVQTVYRGSNVLRPAYDLYGQLWVVDRTSAGARLSVVRAGEARRVSAPGIAGEQVVRFVLSRDGTRVVAQVRRDGVDRLVVARVERDAKGRVRDLLPAATLPLAGSADEPIRDLGWRTPGSLAVLTGPSQGTSQVLIVKIDGSSTPEDLSTDAELFRDEAERLVTSPSVGAPLYIRTAEGKLFTLAASGRWTGTSVADGLVAPTFVG